MGRMLGGDGGGASNQNLIRFYCSVYFLSLFIERIKTGIGKKKKGKKDIGIRWRCRETKKKWRRMKNSNRMGYFRKQIL